MQTLLKTVLASASICLIASCAGRQFKGPDIEERFTTNILDDGTKQFNYEMSFSPPNNNRMGRGMGRPGGGGMGRPSSGMGRPGGMGGRGMMGDPAAMKAKMEHKIKTKLTTMLNAKIEETGYCREGFLTIDETILTGEAFVRGECKDTATEDDHNKFPNTIADNKQ